MKVLINKFGSIQPLLLLLFTVVKRSSGFVRPRHIKPIHSINFYRNDGEGNNNADVPATSSSFYTVPVIGPIPQAPPLLIGGDLFLDSPTPLQWKTIENCVEIHAAQTKNNVSNLEKDNAATIEAAPLIAILDETQTKSATQVATLAAVVGVSNPKSRQSIDTSNASNFMNSLRSIRSDVRLSRESRIRLEGIGRATLQKFETQETQDGPIIIAQFQLVMDDGTTKTSHKLGPHDKLSTHSSPVHAINEMSLWANRVKFIHDDRRKLVQGIQAAIVQLERASRDWQDYDGIGELALKKQNYQEQPDNEAVSFFDPTRVYQDKVKNLLETFVQNRQSRAMSAESAALLSIDNYGVSIASQLSSIDELTAATVERLKPYYSPACAASEEFYYGVYSFVALKTMLPTLSNSQLSWACTCQNTTERFLKVYEWMQHHKILLREVAESKAQELRDCGEECDLF